MALSPEELARQLTHTELESLCSKIFGTYKCSFNVASVQRTNKNVEAVVELDNNTRRMVRVKL